MAEWHLHFLLSICAVSLLNLSVIDKYRSVGGVRLEDDVLVTDDGVCNLTVGHICGPSVSCRTPYTTTVISSVP